ncbi:cell wall hydrolase [Mesorhizobium sp. Cs1299R1N1]|uniref:cell wall hydrolase n=1 Tax=Mesorhizobium sp. Cs1299R1N1 TaxID=3015172 RepID=UPI00301BA138
MLFTIRDLDGGPVAMREKPSPDAPIVNIFLGGETVDAPDPQPPIPAGSTGSAADWSFVTFATVPAPLSGWVERRFLAPVEPKKRPPLDEEAFVRECVRAELDSNAGDSADAFPVDADYLIAWAIIESGISNPAPDKTNDNADGPFGLTDTEWKSFLADSPEGTDPTDRELPILHAYTAAYVSREQMQALSDKLTALPVPTDGPYVPTYLNVLHAHLIGVNAAVAVQKSLLDGKGSDSMETALAAAFPVKADRDALISRRELFLKDGGAVVTVDGFNAKTSRALNTSLTRAYKLINKHFPELIPPKAEIGSSGSWFDIAQAEMAVWKNGNLTESDGDGKARVLEYFASIGVELHKVEPWCGAFVGHCLKKSGEPGGSSVVVDAGWAANWKKWGDTQLRLRAEDNNVNGIPKGAIVVFEPLATGTSGHVGFFESLKSGNMISIIGGNQTGGVSLKSISRGKIVAIRWLATVPPPAPGEPTTKPVPGSPVGGTTQDVLILARTLYGEARGEFDAEGKGDFAVEAVANVVINRVVAKFRKKTTVQGVCLDPKQFSCWNGSDPNRSKIIKLVKGSDAPRFDRCLDIATRAVAGQIADHTGGALHYHATGIVKPSWVKNSPAAKVSLKVGHHIFYVGIK